MMIPQEYGGNETDSPDELIYKKLAYIQQRIPVVAKDVTNAQARKLDAKAKQDLHFFTHTLDRYWSEKLETLRSIGHHGCGTCRCIYCERVLGVVDYGCSS